MMIKTQRYRKKSSSGNSGSVQARKRQLRKQLMITEDTNASASIFGWHFQIYATIFLMLKNIRDVSTIRVEGKNEDIEITLNDGKKLYGQAKSRQYLEAGLSDSQATSKLSEGLRTLYSASKKQNSKELIYICNFHNPLGGGKSEKEFFSASEAINRKFDTLPDSVTKLGRKKIKEVENKAVKAFPIDELVIWVMPFDGEDKEVRNREVSKIFRQLLQKMKISENQANNILEVWTGDMFFNASTRSDIQLSKEDLIWALIVYTCDLNGNDDIEEKAHEMGLLEEDIEEITDNYHKFIEQKSEKFEFSTKVNSEYESYKRENRMRFNSQELLSSFIEDKWKMFIDEVSYEGIEEEIQEGLIRIILYKLINKSKKINKVIQEVGI